MKILQLSDLTNDDQDLVRAAVAVVSFAYRPYSKYSVGAAVMEGGKIYTGWNLENAAYSGTHAEEGAIASIQPRASGIGTAYFVPRIERVAIALVVPQEPDMWAAPCGRCRQHIREFATDATPIFGARLDHALNVQDIQCFTLGELLPYSFVRKNLDVSQP